MATTSLTAWETPSQSRLRRTPTLPATFLERYYPSRGSMPSFRCRRCCEKETQFVVYHSLSLSLKHLLSFFSDVDREVFSESNFMRFFQSLPLCIVYLLSFIDILIFFLCPWISDVSLLLSCGRVWVQTTQVLSCLHQCFGSRWWTWQAQHPQRFAINTGALFSTLLNLIFWNWMQKDMTQVQITRNIKCSRHAVIGQYNRISFHSVLQIGQLTATVLLSANLRNTPPGEPHSVSGVILRHTCGGPHAKVWITTLVCDHEFKKTWYLSPG